MYVCVCNAVTDSDIRNAVDHGVRNLGQLRQATDCGATCGSCNETALEVLHQALTTKRQSESMLPIMQLA
ncbi:bacterioferritin-associated ferredoxin [Pseudomonadota bacterium]